MYDYGFSSANTENVIISASTGPDFGLWKVNASNCVINTGKLAVTGLTGNGPFTYLWSDGQTTQVATGLTQGTYTVIVTDYYGCQSSASETVGLAPPLGVGLSNTVNPSCFASDGSISYTLTGRTPPFYYSANTGAQGYTLSNTFTISNLPSGGYNVFVRDANFCPLNLFASLTTVNGFNVISNTVVNSNCNPGNGKIISNVQGISPFLYSLSGIGTNYYTSFYTTDELVTFNTLQDDTYILLISGQSSGCYYVDSLVVNTQSTFGINVSLTGSTCGSPNGSVTIEATTGYTGPLDFILIGDNTQSVIDYPLSSYTFNYLLPGNYTIQVTDYSACTVTQNITIGAGVGINTNVIKTDCVLGNDGTAQAIIYDGVPPFTYGWSSNVPVGQTGSTINGLSGGTYQLIVTDSSGCTDITNFTINCNVNYITGTTTYEICDNSFTTTTGTKRGLPEMISEGFLDLTTGYTNCIMNNVTLNCQITLNGSAFTETFYIANDTSWQTAIDTILGNIPQVGDYNVNLLNNTLYIESNCQGGIDPIGSSQFTLELSIDYDISCEGIVPTPTATPIPTATPTPTPTATPTPTPTPTSSVTPTPTATPTPTPTPTPNYTVWYGTGNMFPLPSSVNACNETNCSTLFYTTGATLNVGDVIYGDSGLTINIGYLSVNYGPAYSGWGSMFLSNDCPIVGTRTIVQVNNLGKIISKYIYP